MNGTAPICQECGHDIWRHSSASRVAGCEEVERRIVDGVRYTTICGCRLLSREIYCRFVLEEVGLNEQMLRVRKGRPSDEQEERLCEVGLIAAGHVMDGWAARLREAEGTSARTVPAEHAQ